MVLTRSIRLGIIGAGAIVRLSHLPAISQVDGIGAVAIADPDQNRATLLAHEHAGKNTIEVFTDYRTMIDQGDLDAVLIATPNNLHRDNVDYAARAGLHIFVEKPLAHTLEDALALHHICDDAGIITQTGFNQRYWEPVQLAKKGLYAGVTGNVHAFRSVYSESYTAYPAATDYRYNLQQSGGASILDLGIHRIDIARYLLGDIVEVCATIDHRSIPFPADDTVFLLLRFATGATGVISSDRFSPQISSATDLYGDTGTIHFSTETINPFQSAPLAFSSLLDQEKLPTEYTQAHWPQAWWLDYQPGQWVSMYPPRINPYQRQWAAFVAAINGTNEPDRPTITDAVKAQEVVSAAYRSVREHRWVQIPLTDPAEPIPSYT